MMLMKGVEVYREAVVDPQVAKVRGMTLSDAIQAFGFVACVICVVTAFIVKNRGISWAVALLGILLLILVWKCAKGTNIVAGAFVKLNREFDYLLADYAMARNLLTKSENFSKLFPVSQDQVRDLLKTAAERVSQAHYREVELLHGGLQLVSLDAERSDQESFAVKMQQAFDQERQARNKAVKMALADFYSKRDLLREEGFETHNSWKDYLPPEAASPKTGKAGEVKMF